MTWISVCGLGAGTLNIFTPFAGDFTTTSPSPEGWIRMGRVPSDTTRSSPFPGEMEKGAGCGGPVIQPELLTGARNLRAESLRSGGSKR